MNLNIEELITLNYELEGLLYLALHRGDDTPPSVWKLISSKIETMRENISAMDVNAELSHLPVPEEIKEEPLTEDRKETIIKEGELEAAEAEPMEEPRIEEYSPIEEMEPVNQAGPISQNEPIQQPEPINESEPINSVEPIRLDEKLARECSKDLRKAFSLNDKFRFRRELFGNSDAMMMDTIETVSAMNSLDEALEYFYDTLEWDKDNPEVVDFVNIIAHHFSGK